MCVNRGGKAVGECKLLLLLNKGLYSCRKKGVCTSETCSTTGGSGTSSARNKLQILSAVVFGRVSAGAAGRSGAVQWVVSGRVNGAGEHHLL